MRELPRALSPRQLIPTAGFRDGPPDGLYDGCARSPLDRWSCWGANFDGRYGSGSGIEYVTPTPIPALGTSSTGSSPDRVEVRYQGLRRRRLLGQQPVRRAGRRQHGGSFQSRAGAGRSLLHAHLDWLRQDSRHHDRTHRVLLGRRIVGR